jgi:hypothetical protein
LTGAVLSYLGEMASHLDAAGVTQTLENISPSSSFAPDIRVVHAVYAILRYTPMEYLPKSIRADLTKKAVVFDGQLVSTLKPEFAHGHSMAVLALSREFMSRSLAHAVVFDRLV